MDQDLGFWVSPVETFRDREANDIQPSNREVRQYREQMRISDERRKWQQIPF
jgi:hypothetical protein